MGKREAEEETKSEILQVMETELATQNQHPYAFHVSGPRNVPSINWRDLISSNWSKIISKFLFVSAVYLSLMNEKLSKTLETTSPEGEPALQVLPGISRQQGQRGALLALLGFFQAVKAALGRPEIGFMTKHVHFLGF